MFGFVPFASQTLFILFSYHPSPPSFSSWSCTRCLTQCTLLRQLSSLVSLRQILTWQRLVKKVTRNNQVLLVSITRIHQIEGTNLLHHRAIRKQTAILFHRKNHTMTAVSMRLFHFLLDRTLIALPSRIHLESQIRIPSVQGQAVLKHHHSTRLLIRDQVRHLLRMLIRVHHHLHPLLRHPYHPLQPHFPRHHQLRLTIPLLPS